MLTARPGSSVGRAPPWFGVVPGSNPGQVTFGFQQEFLNSSNSMVKVYMSTTIGQYPGLSLSRGNWILIALLIGNDSGGYEVGCLFSFLLRVVLMDYYHSLACVAVG